MSALHDAPQTVSDRLEEIERDLAERQNVALEDRGFTSPCWIWQRYVMKNGYGQTWDGTRVVYAHRYTYGLLHGEVPAELDHLCRVRCCCNPAHLESVSRHVNARRGARSKLTLEQVAEILASDKSQSALGRQYGVTKGTIAYYKSGEYERRLRAAA